MSRILKTYPNYVTQPFKLGQHGGIDIVGNASTKGVSMVCDYIIAHSDGVVVDCRGNYDRTDRTGGSYGNFVKIQHNNGYFTLYAHMKYGSVRVRKGDTVKCGDVLGYMGNTGHSFGAHLHFEVRNTEDSKIDPMEYINADLPNVKKKKQPICILVKPGDTLNGISATYNVPVEKLIELNKKFHPSLATNPNYIRVGWTLRLK